MCIVLHLVDYTSVGVTFYLVEAFGLFRYFNHCDADVFKNNPGYGGNVRGTSGKHQEHREATVNHLNPSLPLFLCFHFSRGQTHVTPTHAASNSCHRSNGHRPGSASVEGYVEQQGAAGTGPTGSSHAGAGLRGSTEEQSGHVPPREDLLGYPSCLDSTLQHIARQLDILTQVSRGNSPKILNC